MKTTVIIPTFNRVKTLPHAIRSLTAQRGDVDLDILVINDGSTDGTGDLLDDLSGKIPELRVVTKANQGVCAARNTGLDNLLPETSLVSFLDSDDISPKGRFAADIPHFIDNPDIELTYGRMMYVDALDYENGIPAKGSKQADIIGVQLSSAIFRRSLIDRIDKFDPEMIQGEDTDFLLRVFEANTRYVQTDTMCVYYLRHPDSLMKDGKEAARYFALAIRKSMLRRKADPSIVLNKPDFDVMALKKTGYF